MLKQPKLATTDIFLLTSARKKVRALEEELGAEALQSVGLKAGDLVQEVDTGLRYRIITVQCFISNGEVCLTILANRVYKNGRRPARSWTSLSGWRYEKVVDSDPEPA